MLLFDRINIGKFHLSVNYYYPQDVVSVRDGGENVVSVRNAITPTKREDSSTSMCNDFQSKISIPMAYSDRGDLPSQLFLVYMESFQDKISLMFEGKMRTAFSFGLKVISELCPAIIWYFAPNILHYHEKSGHLLGRPPVNSPVPDCQFFSPEIRTRRGGLFRISA
jgi:hypothetical protein